MKKDTPRVAALTSDLAIERERVRQYEERYNAQARDAATAAYIAPCSPDRILALLDRLSRYEAVIEAARDVEEWGDHFAVCDVCHFGSEREKYCKKGRVLDYKLFEKVITRLMPALRALDSTDDARSALQGEQP